MTAVALWKQEKQALLLLLKDYICTFHFPIQLWHRHPHWLLVNRLRFEDYSSSTRILLHQTRGPPSSRVRIAAWQKYFKVLYREFCDGYLGNQDNNKNRPEFLMLTPCLTCSMILAFLAITVQFYRWRAQRWFRQGVLASKRQRKKCHSTRQPMKWLIRTLNELSLSLHSHLLVISTCIPLKIEPVTQKKKYNHK